MNWPPPGDLSTLLDSVPGLTAWQSHVVHLVYSRGVSIAAAADDVGVDPTTVATALSQAYRLVARYLFDDPSARPATD